ncbi:hypothetical protein SynBIOSE41_03858 [Synechococcus sp. BIOS-E4-1]|nr:hypothetical protein SynBIOSE41_03858 [Synechococcus sp. BIOS-E4-1]
MTISEISQSAPNKFCPQLRRTAKLNTDNIKTDRDLWRSA